ncbi:unnamed protein product [Cyprideis torosa]|uniref:Uncharacterized protein n=1 Tax=Cyprideis torosa TaxID=163714 RepID=A0A7R8W8E5_9CRUS|nr:unnamed protein product [Cyprideis torosa]CAG0887412.1 unnamed protein product [Cyprideis torosa]
MIRPTGALETTSVFIVPKSVLVDPGVKRVSGANFNNKHQPFEKTVRLQLHEECGKNMMGDSLGWVPDRAQDKPVSVITLTVLTRNTPLHCFSACFLMSVLCR